MNEAILVTGATGNAGGGVVHGLLELGIAPRALVRAGAERSLPEGVEAISGDLNDPSSFEGDVLDGVEAVFLLSGYDGLEQTLTTMKRAGVRRVVLLSSSAAPGGDLENAVAAYHIRSEAAVRESGLAWTFLQPNSFMSNALRWLPQLEHGDVIKVPFAGVPIATIDPDDLGAVAALALSSDAHEGRTYRLSGPEALLPQEQVAILAEVTGRPLSLYAQPDGEARVEMEGAMPKAYVDAFFSFFVDGTVDETTVHPTVEQVLGRQPRSFRDWAHAHAGAFR